MAKKKSIDESIQDLDLVPIMNLVVCLIPMVLAGTSLVKLGVINVSAPKFGVGGPPPDEEEQKPLNLTVAIGQDGYRLSAPGTDINAMLGVPVDPTGAAGGGVFIPKKGDDYDFAELYNKMRAMKDKFEAERTINMTADPRLPFKEVVRTMDALRFKLVDKSVSDVAVFRQSKNEMGAGGYPVEMWPDVVFAVAQ